MSKSFQLKLFPLRAPTIAAGASDTLGLDSIPTREFNRIAHVVGFLFSARITPTFTTAPTVFGLNNLVSRMTFNDGEQTRFDGSFNSLRLHGLLASGRNLQPDPDTNTGTGNAFYFRRFLPMGPKQFSGRESDFMVPAAMMRNGSIQMNFGALTSISADTTAYTASIEVSAVLAYLDNEVRVPPIVEWNSFTFGSSDYLLNGRALYAHLGIQAGSLTTVTALTAGQVGNVTVDLGNGSTQAVSAQSLTALAHEALQSGKITELQGDPGAATDDNGKEVNAGTPTALQSAAANLQPVVVSGEGSRITKLWAETESGLRVRWSGGLTSGLIHSCRLLPTSATSRAAMAAKALTELRLRPSSGVKVKTLSKADYNGPRVDYFPHAAKI